MKTDISTIRQDKIDELITELKLLINKRLYEDGHISEEIYTKSKELIIKQ